MRQRLNFMSRFAFNLDSIAASLSTPLLVVMPVYNEEANIENVIAHWSQSLRDLRIAFQILVLDDGSRDRTHEILLELETQQPQVICVLSKPNGGHGSTCRIGYDIALRANAEWILQIDSDGQCDPQFFAQFWRQRENYDCLFGERVSRDDGLWRTFVSIACREALRLFSGVSIADPNVPYRLMSRVTLARALTKIPCDFDLQNIALALVLKRDRAVRFGFIPIHFRARRAGRNSLNLSQIIRLGWKMLADLKRIR
ncbi:MAG: glycosyltransferase family 2 protein [Verrucomicrobiota bacterium]|nr:glycosyltransferase family 2 protein [Verrucomicrobiota bacterium]